MTISISKLESISTSQTWTRDGVRVNIGDDVALFNEECDAEDAVIAVGIVDDVLEIIEAAKRWRSAVALSSDATVIETHKCELIKLIDGVSA